MRDALADPIGGVFDSELGTVAKSYAEALINAASKAGEVESVVGELEEFEDDVLRANPRFAALLASPSVPSTEKDRILSQILDGRAQPTVARFLRVLSRHGRLGILSPIVHETRAIWDRKLNRKPVTVTSAVDLADDQKAALADKIQAMIGATPILSYRVDPSLLGGLIIQDGDDLYDASIKTKLALMRRRLVEGKTRLASAN